MKQKTIMKALSALFFILMAMPNYAMTAEEALSKFRARMNAAGGLSGTISWGSGNEMMYSGSFKYMPGKIYVKLNNPAGKIICCNGRKLWVYNHSNNICGVQDMTGSSGGLSALLYGYNGIVMSQGSGGYTLKLTKENAHYSEVTLRLDSNFSLKSVALKNASKESLRFTLTFDSAPVMNSHFEFNTPSNAQVIKNPLQIK